MNSFEGWTSGATRPSKPVGMTSEIPGDLYPLAIFFRQMSDDCMIL